MIIADLYYSLEGNNIIISGEYNGGTWRITHTNGGNYIAHHMPRHCRGFLSLGETNDIFDALKLVDKL